MKNLTQVRWHSRAGQGAVTASVALAQIIGDQEGYYAQAFSEYGAEKRGAPVAVFNRIANKEITFVHQIEHPDFVVLFDTTLLNPAEFTPEDVVKGLNNKGKLLINCPEKIGQELAKNKFTKLFKGEIWYVDATKIAIDEIGRNIPNLPMLAALLKISGIFPLEEFEQKLEGVLSKLPKKIIEGNIKAYERGAKEVFKIK